MKKDERLRVYGGVALITCLFLFVGYRLIEVGYLKHSFYSRTAQAQSDRSINVLNRGSISFHDRTGATSLAAANKKFPNLAVTASKIDRGQRDEVIAFIAELADMKPESVATLVDSNSSYIRVLPHHLTTEQVQRVQDRQYSGLAISYTTDRFYPFGSLAADVIGFLGYTGDTRSGQYGLESYYDKELSGQADTALSLDIGGARRGLARWIPWLAPAKKSDPATAQPKDLVLTIDHNIQAYAEERLDKLLKQWNAPVGSVIIQEPTTGKILALVDRPTFDPNDYSSAQPEAYLNGTTQQIFEPGSSFKPVTMGAGLDTGKVTPNTSYEDTGSVQIAGYTIKNFSGRVFGRSTMTQVLENSINTGTMFVENLIGDDAFLNAVINSGFGQRTGVDLPGEINGDISNLYTGRKINYLTASFGQGIAVAPLQLVNFYSAIANGGKLMRPYVVERTIGSGGQETATQPEVISIPMTEKTAATLRTMLVSVVDRGFDKARIPGYDVAGKTGTAQIPAPGGGYVENQYIHTFAGFAPASAPRFVILIKMERPQGITFAADSLSPAFRDIASFLLNYYNVPPTR